MALYRATRCNSRPLLGSIPLIKGMKTFFQTRDNCDESLLFGYHGGTVAGVYIGAGLGKRTAESALGALISHVPLGSSRAVAELCGNDRHIQRVLGVVLDTDGDLAAIQKTAFDWSTGSCAILNDSLATGALPDVTVLEVSGVNNTGTITNSTSFRFGRKRASPESRVDGVCATHLIQSGDTCDSLSRQYGVTINDLEKWNKGKTWAWTECKDMLFGYNMCVGDGSAPMPPPQKGTQCGPLVPGTQAPTDKSVSLADINPCPLKSCCSNWGYCGVFPAHCDIHAPAGGGPGTKEKGFQNTCVSNCGNEIKLNSGPPSAFQRIGYYESFNFARPCLWLNANDSNTDGTYTHIHWAFADIDANSWRPIINNSGGQWDDFKRLQNVRRIVSLGGWAASTEPATYNIIRSAIIEHRDVFASNLAQFSKDEGIDGIDIDWEYPGVSKSASASGARGAE
jgi:hypothetical protein